MTAGHRSPRDFIDGCATDSLRRRRCARQKSKYCALDPASSTGFPMNCSSRPKKSSKEGVDDEEPENGRSPTRFYGNLLASDRRGWLAGGGDAECAEQQSWCPHPLDHHCEAQLGWCSALSAGARWSDRVVPRQRGHIAGRRDTRTCHEI